MSAEADTTTYRPREEPIKAPHPVTSSIPDTVVPLSAGSIIPGLMGYSGLELIAHGSSAIVFRATQNRLNRKVAIKVLLVDDVMTTDATVRRELETLVQLSSSPHIVSIIDTGVTDAGQPYIVMEYCEGGSYAQILKERGPLPVEEVIEVGIKIGEALHAAHEAGIIHRDVKPPNILRSRFGPALTDFGIAYATDELASTDTFYKLTPHHASPETLQQEHQTGQSDLYSLASTMWNLLAAHPPFANPGQDPEAFRQRVLSQPVSRVPRDDVPEWLQAELQRAMAKRATDRHPTALAFAETLRLNMARTSMSVPWQPRSPSPSESSFFPEASTGQTQTAAQTQRTRQNSVPPVSPGGSPRVVLPGTSAPPTPPAAPTSGATANTPAVVIPSAPTSGSTVTVGRPTHPVNSAPLPVVFPGGFNPPTPAQPRPSSPPVSGPHAASPKTTPAEQTERTQQTPPTAGPAATTPAQSMAPPPASAARTYKSRPSHVPLPLDQRVEGGAAEESAGGFAAPASSEPKWFEPASTAPSSSTATSPYQRDYTAPPPNGLVNGMPALTPQQNNPYSGAGVDANAFPGALPQLLRRPDPTQDYEDEDEEQFSWRRPLVTAGVIGVLLGLITTVGIIVAGGAGTGKKTDPNPTTSASIVAEGKPTNVTLSDNSSAVTLQWKDNSGAGAGAIILGRPANASEFKAVGNPAHGQTSYTIASIQGKPLDSKLDYCFRIGSVISNERLAVADPVCTERGGAHTN